MELIGRKITFPRDNEIVFYQDFRWWKNVPHNIEFTITRKCINCNDYWLKALGHGEEPHLGNGKIAIPEKDILKFLKPELA